VPPLVGAEDDVGDLLLAAGLLKKPTPWARFR
jgi:hypothetical protein